MGSRSLGGLLLRSSSLNTHPIPQISSPIWRRTTTPSLCQRSYYSSPSLRAAQAAQRAEPDPEPDPEPSDSASHPKPTTNEELSGAIDELFHASRSPAAPSSTTSTIDAEFRRAGPPETPPSSSNALESAHRQFGLNFSKPANRLGPRGLDIDAMDMGDSFNAEPLVPVQREEDIKYPRLGPTYGRTVKLEPMKGRDIVKGLNMLGSLMARNKVKADFQKQRFHERPGLKKKRLKNERWRARFKVGFADTCKRVTDLTRKGW